MEQLNTTMLETPEEIISNEIGRATENLSQRMMNPELMALRAQLPFVSIMPLPNMVLSAKLLAGVAVDIDIPQGTKIIAVRGNGDYFVNRRGMAVIPTNTGNLNDQSNSGNIFKPDGQFYYVEEIRQLSAVSVADSFLTVACFAQL